MRMVDVGHKDATVREARAIGRIDTTSEVLATLRAGTAAKGDVAAAARLAGIMGAKKTPDLIPLCHPIAISGAGVDVDFSGPDSVLISARVRTTDRTGVEMEALTAVCAAALTVVDMIKSMDPAARLSDIKVMSKTGGKTGDWVRPDDR